MNSYDREKRTAGSTTQYVPLAAIADGILVVEGGAARATATAAGFRGVAVIEVEGTAFHLRSAEERAALVLGYQAWLKALRPGRGVQLLIRRRPYDLSASLQQLDALATERGVPPIYRQLAAAHADHLERLSGTRPLYRSRCYLIVSAAAARRPPFALPGWRSKSRQTNWQQRTHAIQEELNIQCERALAALAAPGLSAHRLDDEELAQLAASCLVAARHERGGWPGLSRLAVGEPMREEGKDRPRLTGWSHLADVLAPSALLERPSYLQVEDDYVRSLAVVGYPREAAVGFLTPLLTHDAPLDISIHIHMHDPAVMLRHFRRRKAELRASKRLATKQGWVDNPDEQVAATDVERLLLHLAAGQEMLCEVGLYIQVHARTIAELDEHTERLLALLRTMLLVAHPATFEHLVAYQTMQPFCEDVLRRTTTLDTMSVAYAFPFVSNGLIMPGGVLEGVTTTGEPVIIDDWADELDNPHRFIGAITGAGKSYYAKLKILRELIMRADQGFQVAVIDPEQEYRDLCQTLSGDYIQLAPGSTQHLNPFDLLPAGMSLDMYLADRTRGDRLAEKVQTLHALFDLMLADRGSEGAVSLSSREKGLLDRALYETYHRAGITADPATHHRPVPLLRDLYQVLVDGSGGKDTYGLADRLYRYVEGSLAGIFTAPTDVELTNRLVVFDIRAMSGDLRPIAIFLIADFMWTQVLTSHRPRALYIDEAWSLIQYPEGGRFLADLARRARKRYLRLVTITQNPELFVDDPWGSVVASNAATKVLKKQDRTSAEAVTRRFQLTAGERQRLLTFNKPEALLLVGGQRVVVQIEANPLEHRLATTDPRELAGLAQASLREQPRGLPPPNHSHMGMAASNGTPPATGPGADRKEGKQ